MRKNNTIIIKKIFWKRTYLFIEYTSSKVVDLYLKKNRKNDPIYLLMDSKKLDNGINNYYRAKINITIAEEGLMLSAGTWHIETLMGDDIIVDNNICLSIEDISRVFRYTGDNYAYIATFALKKQKFKNIAIEETGEGLLDISEEESSDEEEEINEKYTILLKTSFMRKHKHPEKRTYLDLIRESHSFKQFFKKLRIYNLKLFIKCYYAVVSHLTPKNGKRVLFMSENRLHIMDNLEAIDNRMKERGLDKEFKVSYSFRNIFASKKQKRFEWLKVLTKIALQDYIFIDDYAPIFGYIKLNKKTTLVQTWHAGFGFKLVGYGRFGISGSPKPYVSCHRNYTYGLIGNENLKEIYSEVWGIERDKLLPTGLPRLEHLLDKDKMKVIRESLYNEHPDFKDKKVILFAPTYRGSSQFNATYHYELIDFDALYNYCKKNNAVFLFGKHHFIRREIPIPEEYKDLIYDFSSYKLNDVFYITDVLITDYSSAFYDFLLLKKPVLFFVYDKDVFTATRGVHRPIENVAPGKVCLTFKDVLNALESEDYENDKGMKDFLVDKCVSSKMLASDKVINYVLLHEKVNFDE